MENKNGITDNSDALSLVVQSFGKDVPLHISQALKDILDDKLKGIDFESDMDSKESVEAVIHDYMKKIAPTLKGVSKEIATILTSKMQSEYNLKKKNI